MAGAAMFFRGRRRPCKKHGPLGHVFFEGLLCVAAAAAANVAVLAASWLKVWPVQPLASPCIMSDPSKGGNRSCGWDAKHRSSGWGNTWQDWGKAGLGSPEWGEGQDWEKASWDSPEWGDGQKW